ncbi:hypothetical protein NECAME_13923 [Necator americanus]|uniref:Uncharacterized protein n=1 Tax=Necator americanus TaxID=51031 RepID=W2SRZ4_NECAM|nr:hypothetical protein NECAME_13923 [Necator americanus]ETN72253.1 hypothetical protein NECAME_13923 [Necator americanus]
MAIRRRITPVGVIEDNFYKGLANIFLALRVNSWLQVVYTTTLQQLTGAKQIEGSSDAIVVTGISYTTTLPTTPITAGKKD